MFDPATIQSLKQRAVHQSTEINHAPIPTPSTFVALSAHAWLCVARAKGLANDHGPPNVLLFLADCRARLYPPLDEAYTGNCVRPCFAYAAGSELAAPGGLAKACAAIGRAISAGTEDPLRGCEGWMDEYLAVPRGKAVYVVGYPRFGVYRTDFGWGPPGRVELVSMNHDGEVVLVAGKEEGAVQASVAVSADQKEMFAEQFVGVGWDGKCGEASK